MSMAPDPFDRRLPVATKVHRCDETCVCPSAHHSGLRPDSRPALYYASSTGEHACQDLSCPNAHGMVDYGTVMRPDFSDGAAFHAARAKRGFCSIPSAITCPSHPEVLIGTDLWMGFCAVCGTTAEQAVLAREALGGMTSARVEEAIELMRASGMAMWHRPPGYQPAPGAVARSIPVRLVAGVLYSAGRLTGWALGKAYLRAAPLFERASKARK